MTKYSFMDVVKNFEDYKYKYFFVLQERTLSQMFGDD